MNQLKELKVGLIALCISLAFLVALLHIKENTINSTILSTNNIQLQHLFKCEPSLFPLLHNEMLLMYVCENFEYKCFILKNKNSNDSLTCETKIIKESIK